jgi:hypothetical protein
MNWLRRRGSPYQYRVVSLRGGESVLFDDLHEAILFGTQSNPPDGRWEVIQISKDGAREVVWKYTHEVRESTMASPPPPELPPLPPDERAPVPRQPIRPTLAGGVALPLPTEEPPADAVAETFFEACHRDAVTQAAPLPRA